MENRQRLYDKLQVGITDSKDYPQYSNIEDSTYADLYCDNKKCKFFAGYVDKVTDETTLNYEAKWMVGDNDTRSTSEAIYINPNKESWQSAVFEYNKGQKLNLCETVSDTKGKFGIYNPDGSPVTNTKTTTPYKSKVHVTKTDSTSNITNLECLNYAKSVLPVAYWHSYIKSDGSVDTGSINNPDGKKCIFEADCIAPSFETSLSPTGSLKWNFGPNEVKKLLNKQITLDDGKNTKVKFATYPRYAENSWKESCYGYAGGSQCDEIHIPSAWSGLDNNFVNICKTDPSDRTSCMYNDDVFKSPTYLINETIENEQYCNKGVDFSTITGKFTCK